MISGKIKADFTHTRYKVIKDCAVDLGWKPIVYAEKKVNKNEETKDEGPTNKDKNSTKVADKKTTCQTQMVDLYWHDLFIDI